jgi:hypothetical protein
MPVSTVALMATNADRKQATLAFIRKHGVAAFYQKVKLILRRGGLKALFAVPASPETRAYVAILVEIARRRANNNPSRTRARRS